MGKSKLNLSLKEIGRLTLVLFMKLYNHYKNNWDLEMRLTKANMTYAELKKKNKEKEDWF